LFRQKLQQIIVSAGGHFMLQDIRKVPNIIKHI